MCNLHRKYNKSLYKCAHLTGRAILVLLCFTVLLLIFIWHRSYQTDEGLTGGRNRHVGSSSFSQCEYVLEWDDGQISLQYSVTIDKNISSEETRQMLQLFGAGEPLSWFRNPSGNMKMRQFSASDCVVNRWNFYLVSITTPHGSGNDGFDAVYAVGFPIWLIVIIVIIGPAIWFAWLSRLHVRKIKGWCTNCGYDLRFNQKCCPECGKEIGSRAL